MSILRRYLTVHLVQITLLALFALVALFSFFSLIDQLGETGTGNYGIPQALLYVLLTMPRLVYELFPVATVIASMTLLGMLAHNSELDVIRTAGVSAPRLAWLLAQAGLVLVILAVAVGELLAPLSEEAAQEMRSVALTEQITLKTRYGLWMRDGNSFINIRRVLPGNVLEQVRIYEFDDDNRLRSSSLAARGEYRDGRWVMEDVRQSLISADGVTRRDIDRARWDSLLAPRMIDTVAVQPEFLPAWELIGHIRYLQSNAQNSRAYEQALWAKIVHPFTVLAMVILAVPLVKGYSRFTAVGQRVFLGALIGILFHLLSEVSGHLGVVYSLPPMLGSATPTLLLYLLIAYLLGRSDLPSARRSRLDPQTGA